MLKVKLLAIIKEEGIILEITWEVKISQKYEFNTK